MIRKYILSFNFWLLVKVLSTGQDFPIPEQLAQTTIRILVEKDSGTFVGSGFFYSFQNAKVKKSFIVTNKHVVSDVNKTILIFNTAVNGIPSYGKTDTVSINSAQLKWINHPDTTIDLSILELEPIVQHFKNKGKNIYLRTLDETLIPNENVWTKFNYLDEVIMEGYPNGVIDKFNNLPIIRRVSTASIPSYNIYNVAQYFYDISRFGG